MVNKLFFFRAPKHFFINYPGQSYLSYPPIPSSYHMFRITPVFCESHFLSLAHTTRAGKTSILSYRAIEWPFFPPHKPSGQLKSYISSENLFGQRFRLHCLVFCIKCLYILKDGDTLQKVEKTGWIDDCTHEGDPKTTFLLIQPKRQKKDLNVLI